MKTPATNELNGISVSSIVIDFSDFSNISNSLVIKKSPIKSSTPNEAIEIKEQLVFDRLGYYFKNIFILIIFL